MRTAGSKSFTVPFIKGYDNYRMVGSSAKWGCLLRASASLGLLQNPTCSLHLAREGITAVLRGRRLRTNRSSVDFLHDSSLADATPSWAWKMIAGALTFPFLTMPLVCSHGTSIPKLGCCPLGTLQGSPWRRRFSAPYISRWLDSQDCCAGKFYPCHPMNSFLFSFLLLLASPLSTFFVGQTLLLSCDDIRMRLWRGSDDQLQFQGVITKWVISSWGLAKQMNLARASPNSPENDNLLLPVRRTEYSVLRPIRKIMGVWQVMQHPAATSYY